MAATQPAIMAESPLIEVKSSTLHGKGVFATQAIKKGTRIIEYIGEHISHAEADRRYESKDDNDNHTFLFSVDNRRVIDAGANGNDARYFNHGCDPNCESVIEKRRVFIEAIKDIAPGEEMTYDYQIGRERSDPPNIDEIYACKCGARSCRGTMLWPARRPEQRKKKKAVVKAKAKAKAKTKGTASRGDGASARAKGGGSRAGGVSARSKRAASKSNRAGARTKTTRARPTGPAARAKNRTGSRASARAKAKRA